MKPFSENIIFYDTEFSSFDLYQGEILSVGMVKVNGEELYLELEYNGEVSDWVRDNLLHTLTQGKVSRNEAKRLIQKFVGSQRPYTVSYINQFDTVFTYKLFGIDNHPFYWLPIDFASMLFAYGYDPELPDDLKKIAEKFDIDHTKYTQHHALDDAKFLRDIYLKLISQK